MAYKKSLRFRTSDLVFPMDLEVLDGFKAIRFDIDAPSSAWAVGQVSQASTDQLYRNNMETVSVHKRQNSLPIFAHPTN